MMGKLELHFFHGSLKPKVDLSEEILKLSSGRESTQLHRLQ